MSPTSLRNHIVPSCPKVSDGRNTANRPPERPWSHLPAPFHDYKGEAAIAECSNPLPHLSWSVWRCDRRDGRFWNDPASVASRLRTRRQRNTADRGGVDPGPFMVGQVDLLFMHENTSATSKVRRISPIKLTPTVTAIATPSELQKAEEFLALTRFREASD